MTAYRIDTQATHTALMEADFTPEQAQAITDCLKAAVWPEYAAIRARLFSGGFNEKQAETLAQIIDEMEK